MALINWNAPAFETRRDYIGNQWTGNAPEWERSLPCKDTGEVRRLMVNKSTHRLRFENESESEVTIVIEPKEV
jgi:hypothetical protein